MIAPSVMVRVLSGITRFGSISFFVPSPSHSKHAPCGLLNENNRGSISGKTASSCSGQAIFWLKIISSGFNFEEFGKVWPWGIPRALLEEGKGRTLAKIDFVFILTNPCESLSALSTLSNILDKIGRAH